MKLKTLLGVSLLALSLGACATITRGTQQAMVIESTPAGAHVEMSNGMTCTTPCSIRMSRESEFTATISKDGYETISANVTHTTAGAGAAGMAGNVLLGGIVGGVVDANTGATQNLTPNPLSVTLVPLNAPAAMRDAGTDTSDAMAEQSGM